MEGADQSTSYEADPWTESMWVEMLRSMPHLQVFGITTPLSLLSKIQRRRFDQEESALILRWASCLPRLRRLYVAHSFSEQYSEEDSYQRDEHLCGSNELYYQTEETVEGAEDKWKHKALYRSKRVGISYQLPHGTAQLVVTDRADRYHN
jgi:hypothetical protein